MERDVIFEKMVEICKDVFDDDSLIITEASTAEDIEGWDSLTHLTLVDELERTFEVAFKLDEVTESKNLGELLTALIKHINEK